MRLRLKVKQLDKAATQSFNKGKTPKLVCDPGTHALMQKTPRQLSSVSCRLGLGCGSLPQYVAAKAELAAASRLAGFAEKGEAAYEECLKYDPDDSLCVRRPLVSCYLDLGYAEKVRIGTRTPSLPFTSDHQVLGFPRLHPKRQ
eukprot:3286151-Pyramimonas_sp.AAC.1